MKEIYTARNIQYDISPLIAERWSPRAFTGEKIKQEALLPILEAARLAPSNGNSQPWRFIYAHRETDEWDLLFELLVPSNQEWVKNASVLFLILSRRIDDQGRDTGNQSFDTGAAWGFMTLEASRRNTPLHGMAGFDYERAKAKFQLGDNYKVEAMAALGVCGNIENLSEKLRAREKPNSRKSIDEISIEAKQASQWLACDS